VADEWLNGSKCGCHVLNEGELTGLTHKNTCTILTTFFAGERALVARKCMC